MVQEREAPRCVGLLESSSTRNAVALIPLREDPNGQVQLRHRVCTKSHLAKLSRLQVETRQLPALHKANEQLRDAVDFRVYRWMPSALRQAATSAECFLQTALRSALGAATLCLRGMH